MNPILILTPPIRTITCPGRASNSECEVEIETDEAEPAGWVESRCRFPDKDKETIRWVCPNCFAKYLAK